MLKRRKVTLITNAILIVGFIAVFSVSFIPETTLPMYGGKNLSAVYNGVRGTDKVSLMFNVYENTETVNGIIDLLNAQGVKATFFVGGCWADDNGETLVKIVDSGHEIGNHGYFHKDHKILNYEKNREEIYTAGVIVKALCGAEVKLFAPPSGSYSGVTLQACEDLGYTAVMWSKDTIDWRDNDKSVIFRRATENLKGGDLVLMHPKPHTLSILPEIIDYCKENGLRIVTVSENIFGENT
ncbi:MAG: polysaccharide deacetylase family protein [Clostridia bacterium]|nr:polysaccharide deacetylase family protein [Clostridia bacterium]